MLYTIESLHIQEEIVTDELIEGKTIPNMVSFRMNFKGLF